MNLYYLKGLLVACLMYSASGAVRGDQVMYVGGTITAIQEKTEGKVDLDDKAALTFSTKKHKIAIPYNGVSSIEYGQKAGRRLGVALAVSPVALLSKKRKHYVSLSYVDDKGEKQGAVFEVAKGLVGPFVTTIEQRSGKSVEFESEDAKKHFGKEAK
jgi:hypothetical protein